MIFPLALSKAVAALALFLAPHAPTGGHHDPQTVEHQSQHRAPDGHLRHADHHHLHHLRDDHGGPGVNYSRRPKTCSQLRAIWDAAGGNPHYSTLAAAEAKAESTGEWWRVNHNANVTTDRGLWQINSIWGHESSYNIKANARAAVSISHDGTDWQPWSSYEAGTEHGLCGES